MDEDNPTGGQNGATNTAKLLIRLLYDTCFFYIYIVSYFPSRFSIHLPFRTFYAHYNIALPTQITAHLKVYLLGKKAEGDLKRPWKPPPSPFAGLMGQTDQVAPAADADAVEVKPLTEKKDD